VQVAEVRLLGELCGPGGRGASDAGQLSHGRFFDRN
jgi:hypothetical protein